MNAKISRFLMYVEAIMYLLLYDLHDYTFNIINTAKKMYFVEYKVSPQF